ncbi:unnamed protein product, partial [Effrenium voratum]
SAHQIKQITNASSCEESKSCNGHGSEFQESPRCVSRPPRDCADGPGLGMERLQMKGFSFQGSPSARDFAGARRKDRTEVSKPALAVALRAIPFEEDEYPRLSDLDEELPDLEERAVNRRIKNKETMPFLEREAVVKRIVDEIEQTRKRKANKPTIVGLWSPRGTGKTSLVRHLALNDSHFAESRRCGRLLVLTAQELNWVRLEDISLVTSAMMAWHLCNFFRGYSVELSSGQVVNFRGADFFRVVEVLKEPPPRPPAFSCDCWIQSYCQTPEEAFEQWQELTAAAFNATPECGFYVFLDQAEWLVRASSFTVVFSQFPQDVAMFCASTMNMNNRTSEEKALLNVQELPSLAPLSLQAARQSMKEWRATQYAEEDFNQIHFLSAGIPQLLSWAFYSDESTVHAARAMILDELKHTYPEVPSYFNQREVALALILCSAVRWPVADHVPGTSLRWSDIFSAGAAFPDGMSSVRVPRLWWCEDVKIKDKLQGDLKELSIDLNGLLPDYLKLKAGGTTERAKPWGDLVANSLAARFRLYCMAQKVSAEVTWVPFLEIYPTEDPHLRAVLRPFEVCWSEGVDYVRDSEASVESKAGKAIKSNRNFETAHHDLLIPVKRKATGNLEFIAVQCCCGKKKRADRLKFQDKVKKDNVEDMQNVLLQICSESEGWQNSSNKKWARRQEEKKYSLMSCETIIAQLDVLKLL